MGKIRISTLGSEDEKAKKDKAKVRREEKKKRLTHLSGMKGGEKLVDMGAITESTENELQKTQKISAFSDQDSTPSVIKKLSKPPKSRGKAYKEAQKLIDHQKLYPLNEAIGLVKKTTLAKFDASVDLHLNLTEKGVRGQVILPHGTGKIVKVAVADDSLLEKISSGKIEFDILVSSPAMMPKLAKFAKVLGPKGLMPNPKAGTISEKPEELAKKLSSGQTQFKSETEAPLLHFTLGKVSFPDKNLAENFTALISAVGPVKIKSITLCSSMSPGVKVKI